MISSELLTARVIIESSYLYLWYSFAMEKSKDLK